MQYPAFITSFTPENNSRAFSEPGIFPLNRSKVFQLPEIRKLIAAEKARLDSAAEKKAAATEQAAVSQSLPASPPASAEDMKVDEILRLPAEQPRKRKRRSGRGFAAGGDLTSASTISSIRKQKARRKNRKPAKAHDFYGPEPERPQQRPTLLRESAD